MHLGGNIVCHILLILILAMKICMSIPNTTVLNGNNGNLKYLTLKKKNIGGKIVRKRVADEIDK